MPSSGSFAVALSKVCMPRTTAIAYALGQTAPLYYPLNNGTGGQGCPAAVGAYRALRITVAGDQHHGGSIDCRTA